MSIVVQKYGGSSVADAESIKRVARRIVETQRAGNAVCVVVSAMGDTTDDLLDLAEQVTPAPPARELDMLLTSGERISMALLAMAIAQLGAEARSFTGSQAGVITDEAHGAARIIDVTPGRIKSALDAGHIAIVAGFQGVSQTTQDLLAEWVGVDLDAGILEIARANAAANNVAVRFEQADIFDWVRAAVARGERYDAVILDPAKLTRDRSKVMDALKKYFAMNRMALDIIPPGGLLLTCSCTGLVGEGEFLEMLRRVALNAGREIQVLEVRGAGADHPFRTDVPEGRYLKAVFCRVD